LLDLEEAPNAAEVNIKKEQIPEPIMREYEKLMKQTEKQQQQPRAATKTNQRKSRDLLTNYNRNNDVDALEEELANEIEEDNIRFNGSMVQQLTLLPRKCNFFNSIFTNLKDKCEI
jgi:hypothetical protein